MLPEVLAKEFLERSPAPVCSYITPSFLSSLGPGSAPPPANLPVIHYSVGPSGSCTGSFPTALSPLEMVMPLP